MILVYKTNGYEAFLYISLTSIYNNSKHKWLLHVFAVEEFLCTFILIIQHSRQQLIHKIS